MTKVILVPENKILTEIDDGNPSGEMKVDSGMLPYNEYEGVISTWQKVCAYLDEISSMVDYEENKKFCDQVSELGDFAEASMKLNIRRLESFYGRVFSEEIEEKARRKNINSSILRFE